MTLDWVGHTFTSMNKKTAKIRKLELNLPIFGSFSKNSDSARDIAAQNFDNPNYITTIKFSFLAPAAVVGFPDLIENLFFVTRR